LQKFNVIFSVSYQQTIYEYATRVGQQAVVLVATPGKPNNIYKVFGAKPLEDVVKNIRSIVMDELESALAQQAPPKVQVIRCEFLL
jgi:nuclear respiratory factor 1